MPVGRGFTAARRQASRLAGLVRLPASWQVHTAIRRQASWLATKASVNSNSRWPFALQKYTSCIEAFHLARGEYAPRQLRGKENQPIHPRRKISKPHRNIPTRKGISLTPRQLEKETPFAYQRRKTNEPLRSLPPARDKYAHRQLRGSRAAIGSGGKKARPF